MKRLGIVVLLLAGFVVSASAQFGLMANKLEEMLKPALSGSFNYKGFVDVAYLAGLDSPDLLEITTTQGFKYSSWCFMGAGAGVNLAFPPSQNASVRSDVSVLLPLYADFRFNIGNPTKVGLFIDLKLGAVFLLSEGAYNTNLGYMGNDPSLYLKPSIGVKIPVNNAKQALNLSASYQLMTPRFSNGWLVNFNNLGATLAFEW